MKTLFGIVAVCLFAACQTPPVTTSPEIAEPPSGAVPVDLPLEVKRFQAQNGAPDNACVWLDLSARISAEHLKARMRIRPEVPFEVVENGVYDQTANYRIHSDHFEENTHYQLVIDPGPVPGTTGFASAASVVIEVGRYEPVVMTNSGHGTLPSGVTLPVRYAHVEDVRARVVTLNNTEIAEALPLVGHWFDRNRPLVLKPSWVSRAREVRLPDPPNRRDEANANVAVFEGSDAPYALVVLDAPTLGGAVVSLVRRAELSVLWKNGATDGLVWVVDLATGEPAPNARVSVWSARRKRFEGRTDAEGLLRLPSRRTLEPDARDYEDSMPFAYVLAELGNKQTYALESDDDGIDGWSLGVPAHYADGPQAFVSSMATERGIYRPGESVHAFGVVRKRGANGRFTSPRQPIEVVLMSPTQSEISRFRPTLSRYGTFDLEFELPRHSELGQYSLELRSPNENDTTFARTWRAFDVAEYRAPSFEASVSRSDEIFGQGSTATLDVSARYFYGAVVKHAHARWYARARRANVHFERHERFDFGSSTFTSYDEEASAVGEGELSLDEQGTARFAFDAASAGQVFERGAQVVDVGFEVDVQGAGEEHVAARSVRRFIKAPVLVGIANDRWVTPSDEGWDFEILAVRHDGTPVRGTEIELVLERRHWVTTATTDDKGRVRYSSSLVVTPVETRRVTSAGSAQSVHFDTTAGGGEYTVRASVAEASGWASASVWVTGGESWGPANDTPSLALLADARSYAAGSTATIAVSSPYAHSKALVTLERDGILEARVMNLEGAATPVVWTLHEGHAPNVFAGVALVPRSTGGQTQPLAGTPLRVGYANLRVDTESRRIRVDVEPVSAEIEPGQSTQVRVRTRTPEGAPLRSEVTLWAADEAVLRLTGYQSPDFFTSVYSETGLGVRNRSSLSRWLSGVLDDDSYGADGPGQENNAARSRFLSTAFFTKTVTTAANGEALVDVTFPDNLTRWRVMASANDGSERFGRGEGSLVSRKPLMLTAGLPRFLIAGDVVHGSVVVHDETALAGEASLTVEVASGGGVLETPAHASVALDGHAQHETTFALRATESGTVRLRMTARKGVHRDALELDVPVIAPSVTLQDRIAEGRAGRARLASLALPDGATAENAHVEITVSPSVLAFATEALGSLVRYPYGCAEQKSSALSALLAVESISGELLAQVNIDRARVQESLDSLSKHRMFTGGFSLWEGGAGADPYVTLVVLSALERAKALGYRVDEETLDQAWMSLDIAAGGRNARDTNSASTFGEWARLSRLALETFERSELTGARLVAHGPNAQDTAILAREAANLDRFSLALATVALASQGQTPTSLVERLIAGIEPVRDDATVVRDAQKSLFWTHMYDVRTTAATAIALTKLGDLARAEKLIAGLVTMRGRDGTWGYTANNLWALRAIATYAAAEPHRTERETLRVVRDGRTLAEARFASRAAIETLRLSATEALAGPVEFVASSEGARFSARWVYDLPLANATARENGLHIERTVVDAETGRAEQSPRVGQILRIKLRVQAAAAYSQIAITDPLPAGFEALDTSLETERQLSVSDGNAWSWDHRELRDERVSYFANSLSRGTTDVSYLVRVTRAGTFTRAATHAEAMYDPTIHARLAAERTTVSARR